MHPKLQTKQLTLCPATAQDEPWILKHINDYDIVKFLGTDVPWPYPPESAKSYLDDIIEQMASRDVVIWAIRLREHPDETIGVIEYFFNRQDYNRGFWLGTKYHGRGIMGEALAATQDYLLLTCGYDKIIDTNACSNTASRRLKERLGGRMTGIRPSRYITGETVQEVWETTRERWQEARKTLPYETPEIII